MTNALELQEVGKSYGSVRVLSGFDLDVSDGEFIVLVGPSGCGKSTLLRMIAGLEDISEGDIRIKGRVVNGLQPGQRGIAMVFQNYALYPHMSVAENMGFALRNAKLPKSEIAVRVQEAARKLSITELLARKPGQLSGGQRQRVAIGRAIVREPDVFLFDEPLSNLDAALRVQTRVEIAKLHNELGNTIVYVTHDQVEAMTLADRIVVMNAGKVEQTGTPEELYTRPRTQFVAGFIGTPKMNFIPGTAARGQFKLASGEEIALPPRISSASGTVVLGVRPEHLVIAPDVAKLTGTIQVREYLGERSYLHVVLADGTDVIATTAAPPLENTARLTFDSANLHLFDSAGRALGL
jgi:lactose/L-arabinose transport system ATP-binding protein